jgi:hypothetical protein
MIVEIDSPPFLILVESGPGKVFGANSRVPFPPEVEVHLDEYDSYSEL